MGKKKEQVRIIDKCQQCKNFCKKYVSITISESLSDNKAWFGCAKFEKSKKEGLK